MAAGDTPGNQSRSLAPKPANPDVKLAAPLPIIPGSDRSTEASDRYTQGTPDNIPTVRPTHWYHQAWYHITAASLPWTHLALALTRACGPIDHLLLSPTTHAAAHACLLMQAASAELLASLRPQHQAATTPAPQATATQGHRSPETPSPTAQQVEVDFDLPLTSPALTHVKRVGPPRTRKAGRRVNYKDAVRCNTDTPRHRSLCTCLLGTPIWHPPGAADRTRQSA